MTIAYDTVISVTLNDADYDAVSLSEDEAAGELQGPDWLWYADTSPRWECWCRAERMRDVRLSGTAEVVRLEVLNEMSRTGQGHEPRFDGFVRFVRRRP